MDFEKGFSNCKNAATDKIIAVLEVLDFIRIGKGVYYSSSPLMCSKDCSITITCTTWSSGDIILFSPTHIFNFHLSPVDAQT